MSLNDISEITILTKEQTALMVKAARLRKPLTQKELADRAGISLRSLQRIENAEVLPRAYTWRHLAAHIDLSLLSKVNETPAIAQAKPNTARKWILSISSLITLFLSFGAYVLQSPTFPENLFETFLMLLAGCIIYAVILYRVWK
jgi:transcriptional regulator with XRE-family HTH domain